MVQGSLSKDHEVEKMKTMLNRLERMAQDEDQVMGDETPNHEDVGTLQSQQVSSFSTSSETNPPHVWLLGGTRKTLQARRTTS